MSTSFLEVELKGNQRVPRTLKVAAFRNYLSVSLFANPRTTLFGLASACAELSECSLWVDSTGCRLWLGGASFHLSDEEAAQVRSAFGPFGLRFVEEKPTQHFPCGSSVGFEPSPVTREATPFISPAREVAPPSCATDGGASEAQHEYWAY